MLIDSIAFAVHFHCQCLTPSWTRAAVSGLWMVPVNDVPNLLVFNHALLFFKAASVGEKKKNSQKYEDQSISQLRLFCQY